MKSVRCTAVMLCMATSSLGSCAPEAASDRIVERAQLESTSAIDSTAAMIVRQQRELLRAIVDAGARPLPYVDVGNIIVVNGTEEVRPAFDLPGRSAIGSDYFRLAGIPLQPAHAEAETVEVYRDRVMIYVISTHDGVAPTLVAWQKMGENWQATRITFHAPLDRVAAIRTRFGIVAP
jgi:hypothetical protein